jgi:hypothetical protein
VTIEQETSLKLFKMKLELLLIFLTAVTHQTLAMFEDQAFKFDWRQQYVGEAQNVDFWDSSVGSGVILRTDSNVLASLDADSGQIKWRHIFADGNLLEAALDGADSKYLVREAKKNNNLEISFSFNFI